MNNLSIKEFEHLIDGAEILADGSRGPNVLLTEQNKVIKLFRQKGLFTSNRLDPYALRFERNAAQLNQLGIPSVEVEGVARCSALDIYLVVYPRLPGSSIRELYNRPWQQASAVERFAQFLSLLHEKGIFYKALHLGNVLVQADQSFALIDIQATKFYQKPLSVKKRLRNFTNILHYAEDYALIEKFGFEPFFIRYLEHSELSLRQRKKLIKSLTKLASFPHLKQSLTNL